MTYYLKKHWQFISLAGVCSVIRWGIQIGQSLFKIQMFAGIVALDWKKTLFWFGISLAGYLLNYVFISLYTCFKARSVRDMNNHVRRDLTETLLQMPWRDFHSQQSGEYLAWFTTNVKQMEKLAWDPFFDAIACVAQVVWGILALSTIHWSLVLAALVSAGIFLLTPRLFRKKMENLSAKSAEGLASATASMKELLAGLDVLRLFDQSIRLRRGMAEASDAIEGPECRRVTVQKVTGCVLDVIVTACGMAIILLTAVLSIQGTVIITALSGVGTLVNWVTGGLSELADIYLSFCASRPYFSRISARAQHPADEKPESAFRLREEITLENVHFRYGQKPVLEEVSLRFAIGKKYAVTGPSGCGKSTLLKLLLGWLPEYTGTVRLDGRDAREFSPEQLQKQMSYIEQDVFLFNTTLRENITLGKNFTQEELNRVLRASSLDRDIAALPQGLDTLAGEGGENLSGGQRQRVAIARALIHHRTVLLVDEGTSALDRENADIVEKSLLNNPDLTLILVSHHLTPVRMDQFDEVIQLGTSL